MSFVTYTQDSAPVSRELCIALMEAEERADLSMSHMPMTARDLENFEAWRARTVREVSQRMIYGEAASFWNASVSEPLSAADFDALDDAARKHRRWFK